MSQVHNPAIVYISPAELVVHPKLIEIYGENEDRPALEKSISEKGILESLKVSARTGVNVVLAGKCRLQIARKLLISAVKVEFVESGSPEEDVKLVLDFNLHREGGKTHYQKFHEGLYWERVLRPQAKERQRENARRLNQSNDSNLNHSLNESKSQLVKGKRVIQEVSANLNLSVGSYHKGKKVFGVRMRLVERHIIKSNSKWFKEIDKMSFSSKNLFNSATYLCRQAFFNHQPIPSFNQIYHSLKKSDDYKALPSKVAQLVLKQVDKCFKSYQEAKSGYNLDATKFLGVPKLPNYKHKQKGRNILTFNNQAISRKLLKKGFIKPSGLQLILKTQLKQIEEVRIIPKNNVYIVEAVYEQEETTIVENNRIAAIDIGLNNLATIASNCSDFQSFIVCGRAVKACNQQYNKVKAKLQSNLPQNQFTSRKLEALALKRNNKVDYYLHTASRFIINQLVSQGVTHLIIGKNENWKQRINLGKKTNQNFTNIPHARFIQQLEYKAKLVGIKVTIKEESYTSKCSFLDLEPIKKHENYLGKRVKRGLFRSSSGKTYSADLNGALNILRKVVGDSIFDRNSIVRLVVSPLRCKPYQARNI